MIVYILGWLLSAATVITAIPQTVRSIRTRDFEGFSFTTQLVLTVTWVLWVGYYVAVDVWVRVVSDSFGFVFAGILLILMAKGLHDEGRLRESVNLAIPLLIVGLIVVAMAGELGGPTAYAIALAVLDAATLLPLFLAARRAKSLNGVSLVSWSLKSALWWGWSVYALVIGKPFVAGWMLLMAPLSVIVLFHLVMDRHRTRSAAAPEVVIVTAAVPIP